jgi:hypothetical protein
VGWHGLAGSRIRYPLLANAAQRLLTASDGDSSCCSAARRRGRLRRARKNPDGFIASAACTPVQAMRRIISRCMTSCGGSASSRAPLIIRAPLAAKSRLSRSSRLGTHTRSIQAHLRAARSSPPRPLWFCIVDMQSRFSEGLPHDTQPLAIGLEAAFLQ